MQKMPPAKVRKTQLVDHRTFDKIFHWYFLAIREMVRLDQFLEDPHWIVRQSRFPIARADVRPVIKSLLRLGFVERDASGRLKVASPNTDTLNDVPSEAIRRYHQQVLARWRPPHSAGCPWKNANSGRKLLWCEKKIYPLLKPTCAT
jgi:uncharacterized protein (TIGR02147 family)